MNESERKKRNQKFRTSISESFSLIWFLSVKIGVKAKNLLRLIYMVKFTWQDLEKKLTQG